MNIPEPRLNKIPFIATDLACLLVAGLIGLFAENPFAPLPLLVITSLVLGGGVALLIPYLADYAADCREATARTRTELEEQLTRVQEANESLTRAAAHIKAVEEAVHKSAREAETLPYRMQEKLAEFNDALAAQEESDREALERELEELRSLNSAQLQNAAERIHKATADWTALEATTRRHLVSAQEAARQMEARLHSSSSQPATAQVAPAETVAKEIPHPAAPAPANGHPVIIDARSTPPATNGAAASPTTPPEEFTLPATASFASTPSVAPVPVSSDATATTEPAATVATEPMKAKKPRAPRKPRPEDTLLAMSASPASTETAVAEPAIAEPVIAESVSAESSTNGEDLSGESAAKPESATSSDGATRLLATAYIGIGNKLFIRGDGPGLSWERGVPMQFVSIGKWGWATHDATGAVNIRLYKNDETPALTGDLALEPGRHTEVSALF